MGYAIGKPQQAVELTGAEGQPLAITYAVAPPEPNEGA